MITVKKQFIYLLIIRKESLFFQISIFTFKRLRCKDSLKRTAGEHVFKEKKNKKKERNMIN